MDCSGDFFGTFDSKTNMSIKISYSNESLESCSLSSTCLFLHRHDLRHFVFQRGSEEEVYDFFLLDWQRIQINLFQRFDFQIFNQSSELGDGNPFLAFRLTSSTSPSPASSASTTSSSSSKTSTVTSTITSTSSG